jgi:hypothetical protein
MHTYDYDPNESEREELAAQVASERRIARAYARNPDPRDPDYPGDPEDFPGYEEDDE